MSQYSKIWLSSPHMSGKEEKYVKEAFETNWIAPLGPNVDGFETAISNYTGAPHSAALSSGTSALHLALILTDVQYDDYVICQSFTFSASANPIKYQGAHPIFVDSEEDTWNMCPVALRRAIEICIGEKDEDLQGRKIALKLHRKPKAIIPVHLYGMPAKMDEIRAIAQEYDIVIIEDAAEALGSKYKGKFCGTLGYFGTLSFNGNKIITTSGGGALLSSDGEMIQKARFLSTQARDNAPHFQHSHIGYNYRMSNVVAGIGLGQMEVLQERVDARRANYFRYKEYFKNIEGVKFQDEPNSDFFSNYWLTTILIDPEKTHGKTREDLRLALMENNIEARPLWKPMHLQPIFEKEPVIETGVSQKLFTDGLCLPSGSNLTDSDFERIFQVLDQFFR